MDNLPYTSTAAKANQFVHGLLLTAVCLLTLAPFWGVNPSALAPIHQHIYFGEPDLDHDHGAHSHRDYYAEPLTPLTLSRVISESIAFLPDQDVNHLGLFYIMLIWLTAAVALLHPDNRVCLWQPDYLKVHLVFNPQLKKPPRHK